MPSNLDDTTATSNKANIALGVASVVILFSAGWGFFFLFPKGEASTKEALAMSSVVLVGLALVVMLMAVLVIVYKVLNVANPGQALALPEGSVRALIAFSLVLIFVCMASFLYNSMNAVELTPAPKPLTTITETQLNELKTQFIVAYEPARDTAGKLLTDTDQKPLYNATYYTKRSKDADDFAKQIFTTLATVFVSVISFYFGSSTTAAGVGAGLKAASGGLDDGKKGGDPQPALVDAQTAAREAQSAVDRATEAVKQANALAGTASGEKKITADADVAAAQKALDTATKAARDSQQQFNLAQKAVSDTGTAGADTTKASKALADAGNARDAAKGLAEKAKQSADEAERLMSKIKSDLGSA